MNQLSYEDVRTQDPNSDTSLGCFLSQHSSTQHWVFTFVQAEKYHKKRSRAKISAQKQRIYFTTCQKNSSLAESDMISMHCDKSYESRTRNKKTFYRAWEKI